MFESCWLFSIFRETNCQFDYAAETFPSHGEHLNNYCITLRYIACRTPNISFLLRIACISMRFDDVFYVLSIVLQC